jgi:DHA1 family tetracycline resistance protein-like MFS transporter
MKQLGVLWLVVLISLMGFGVTTIPFPLVTEQMGASDFWKTFGGPGVFSIFQLLATPLWGRYSDSLGRKPILLASLAGSVLAYIWLAYANDLVSLLVARAFGGIMSGNLAATYAYATDVTDVKNRARGLGIVASAFGVGFALGPPLGGWLGTDATGQASLHGPALASAALSALALLATWFLLPESLPPEQRKPLRAPAGAPKRSSAPFAALRGQHVLVGLMIAALAVAVGGASMQSIYQFWGRDLFGFSLMLMSVHFMAFAIFSILGQVLLIGPLVRMMGEKNVALLAAALVVVSLVMFAALNQAWMVWVTIGLFGLANGLFLPAVSSLVSFETTPQNRGAIMGAFNSASSAGRIIGPGVSGPLYFGFGAAAPFLFAALLTLVGGALLSRAHARPPVAAANGPPPDELPPPA